MALLALLLALGVGLGGSAAHAWQVARVEPKVDNLDELLCGCEARRAPALERNRQIDAWVAFKASQGEDVRSQVQRSAVPECAAETITAATRGNPGVWAIAAQGDELYATVNLPSPGLMVSSDGGRSWHYRHLFLSGYNVEHAAMLRGIDAHDGLLAVASETGVLLSTDGGRSFITRLQGKPFSAIAFAAGTGTGAAARRIVAGGNGTSYVSADQGRTWTDLGFSRFTETLHTHNPYLIDHITSVRFDPRRGDVAYVGTGSHLYRVVLAASGGRWQAMEGDPGARVLDDSTVYNIEFGSRMMISTCNGVYYLESLGGDAGTDQADVRWGKFRDAAFSNRGVGGPRGNLRAYFVTEDPDERGRVLIADFAGVYEGTSDGARMRWRRVTDLPYYSPVTGYPEYTSIAWTGSGDVVVGSRYRGIFVGDRETLATAEPRAAAAPPAPAPAARGCVLK